MKLETLVLLKGLRDQHLAKAAALSEVIDELELPYVDGGEEIPPKPKPAENQSAEQTEEQKPSAFVKYDGE